MTPEARHIVLFDLYTGGHHRVYLEQAVRAWLDRREPGRLTVAAPESMFVDHPGFTRSLEDLSEANVDVLHLSMETPLREGDMGLRDVLANDRTHGRVLETLVRRDLPTRVILMYADHVQFSLATGLRFGFDVRFTGVYFRPSFHYADAFASPTSFLTERRKRWLLAAALRNRHVDTWLSLDPYAVPYIQRIAPRVSVRALPDAFEPKSADRTPGEVRAGWKVETGRRVALFFGVIGARKGIHELLSALPNLPESVQESLCLVILGQIPADEKRAVRAAMQDAASATRVQFVAPDAYVSDEEIQDAIRASDVVLVPYRRHIGSSHVLVRAAAAGVPVVGPRWGLMGQYVRDRRLGWSVEPTDPAALAGAISAAVTNAQDASVFDRIEAERFAAEHTMPGFGDALFG